MKLHYYYVSHCVVWILIKQLHYQPTDLGPLFSNGGIKFETCEVDKRELFIGLSKTRRFCFINCRMYILNVLWGNVKTSNVVPFQQTL